jgi:SAM-dependent methyltransferase
MIVTDLLHYYSARAHEYEQVYAKPERQDDLRRLHALIAPHFAGRRVLEVACGTGYWTRVIAPRADSVTACDLSPEVLDVARARQPDGASVRFVLADAFALSDVPGDFDAAFAGFWISHIPRKDVRRFLEGLDRRLPVGSRVMLADNRYVEGSNWPITRTDTAGNTYQRRRLDDGREYEVLKNFLPATELRELIRDSGGVQTEIGELTYYWWATYLVGRPAP